MNETMQSAGRHPAWTGQLLQAGEVAAFFAWPLPMIQPAQTSTRRSSCPGFPVV